MPGTRVLGAGLILLAAWAGGCTMTAAAARTEANRVAELTFTSEKAYADPFNEVDLVAVFRTPAGETLRVPAFWAGGNVWKVRYSSPAIGRHAFRTECSDAANARLHGATGRVEVVAYTGANPLYRHGPIRVAADHRHFEHADAAPFFWLGDTWWMGLTERLAWPDGFKALAADRKAKGFNVVQIVAGLYPDMPAFDPRGANEAGQAWEKGYARIRPEYFDQADRRLQYLADEGIVPCIVGAWGYHLPWLGTDRMKKHWRYLVARYGALPVVWCAAGETTMPWYLSKDKAGDERMQKDGWTAVSRAIHEVDPFKRPLTLHPAWRVPTRASVTDPALVDFELLQTGHGMHEVIGPTADQVRAAREAGPPVPVIDGEPAYENLNNQTPADVCRACFWVSMVSGAAGHTYGANGIWQVNAPGRPYGNSPGGNNWGTMPWPEAMRLPGSTQVALGAKLLRSYEWWRLEPRPDGTRWAEAGPGEPPRAAAVGEKVRIVYVPAPKAVVVQRLAPGGTYRAAWFDPVTGERKDLGQATPASDGSWSCPPPDTTHDWVLILEGGG